MSHLTVSAPRQVLVQRTIWPGIGNRRLRKLAEARVYVGAYFEEATRVLSGATPHTIDGRADICPDLSHGTHEFLEVKALNSSSAYLFAHRLENDRRLCDERFAFMTYVYWLHRTPVRRARSMYQLRQMLSEHVERVLVIPGERIWQATRRRRIFNICYKADGSQRQAYRFNRAELLDLARGPVVRHLPVGRVFGTTIGTIPVHGPDLARLFPPLTAEQRQRAEELLAELSAHQLQIEAVPAPEPRYPGHKVRMVTDCNPAWYSQLCRAYAKKRSAPRARDSSKHFDTDIRRPQVLRALERLAQGTCRYEYDWRLRPFLGH